MKMPYWHFFCLPQFLIILFWFLCFFTILFEKFAGYVIISLEMPTFIQLFYCPNCKKNVSTDNAKKCKRCGTLAKRKGWSVRFRAQASGQNVHKRLSGFKTKKDANRAYIEYLHNLSATAKKFRLFWASSWKLFSKLSTWKCRKHCLWKETYFFQVYHTLFCWQKPKFAVKIWLHSLANLLATEKNRW